VPGGRRLRDLDLYSDPTGGTLVAAVKQAFVDPVMADPVKRPDRSAASLILWGKAGTRKTSLVRALGESLGWPVLTLSPPSFLGEGGLDGFERAADRIFRDLMRLRRCVVLFDECEDFFKPRRPRATAGQGDARNAESVDRPESRTIGAFLTAGMLPRLQELRDRRWVIFALATNIESLYELDDAVVRPGRFDYAQQIRHPVLRAQKVYVDRLRMRDDDDENTAARKALRDALKWFDKESKRPFFEAHMTAMSFAVIDDIARAIAARPELIYDEDRLRTELATRLSIFGPPPLCDDQSGTEADDVAQPPKRGHDGPQAPGAATGRSHVSGPATDSGADTPNSTGRRNTGFR
jgi:SpoVK/Ycf46/Vps4 family AAA+-type ATPase